MSKKKEYRKPVDMDIEVTVGVTQGKTSMSVLVDGTAKDPKSTLRVLMSGMYQIYAADYKGKLSFEEMMAEEVKELLRIAVPLPRKKE